MKKVNQIYEQLINTFINSQDKVTFLGKGGAVSGMFKAFARSFFDLNIDQAQYKRKSTIQYANGQDLDFEVEKKGIYRKNKSKGSRFK